MDELISGLVGLVIGALLTLLVMTNYVGDKCLIVNETDNVLWGKYKENNYISGTKNGAKAQNKATE